MSSRQQYTVLACVLAGSVLRLLWPTDMEWKGDEQLMFTSSPSPPYDTWSTPMGRNGEREGGTRQSWIQHLALCVLRHVDTHSGRDGAMDTMAERDRALGVAGVCVVLRS